MTAALYVLGGVVAALGAVGIGALLPRIASALFGDHGLVMTLLLFACLMGGLFGWLVYRMRSIRRG